MVPVGSIVIYSQALKVCLLTRTLLLKQGQHQTQEKTTVAMASTGCWHRGECRDFSCQVARMELCRWLQRHDCMVREGERE